MQRWHKLQGFRHDSSLSLMFAFRDRFTRLRCSHSWVKEVDITNREEPTVIKRQWAKEVDFRGETPQDVKGGTKIPGL